MPAGYEKIDGHIYPTRELQEAEYTDIRLSGRPGEKGSFLYGKRRIVSMPKLAWPLDKIVITQKFGENPAVYAQFGLKGHDGIDLRTRFIDSPLAHRYVMAAQNGRIEVRDDGKKGYGLHIRLHADDGSVTLYGHLSKMIAFQGQIVKQGDRIAITGSSGFSSGAHLHFEFRPAHANANNGFAGAVDPIPYLPALK